MMDRIINILVALQQVKDQKLILEALSGQKNFSIAGVEKDETGVIIRTDRLKPDVLILDLQLYSSTNPEFIHIIRRRSPATAIIILCDDEEQVIYNWQESIEAQASFTLNAGISGFLKKSKDLGLLEHVIQLVALDGCCINKNINTRVFNEYRHLKQFPGQTYTSTEHISTITFSPAERSVISQMAQGYSDAEIAKYLNYNTGTIKNILFAIKRKAKLKSRSHIVAYSIAYGLIQMDELLF
ncbi:MAG: response regulator transcription factor [Treponema sp.]|nr:response regulator transcription factor [Treponema sp.]